MVMFPAHFIPVIGHNKNVFIFLFYSRNKAIYAVCRLYSTWYAREVGFTFPFPSFYSSFFSYLLHVQVQVMKGDSGTWETRRQVQTDFTRQEETTPLAFFHDKRFTFRFPKGMESSVCWETHCLKDKNRNGKLFLWWFIFNIALVYLSLSFDSLEEAVRHL